MHVELATTVRRFQARRKNLLLNCEERRLRHIEQDEFPGIELPGLASQFAADRTASAGDQHYLARDRRGQRSEEHTSELQSLMRISYAVFCLKKKNNNIHKANHSKHQNIA